MRKILIVGGGTALAVVLRSPARDLGRAWHASGARGAMDIVIGFYERWRDTLYNSAAYVRVGGEARLLHTIRGAGYMIRDGAD